MTSGESIGKSNDLFALVKQIAQPVVDSIDGRVREQIDTRVDQRMEEVLATLRATVTELQQRVDQLEHDRDAV
jgi:BMFP domain-containing protein YqiC